MRDYLDVFGAKRLVHGHTPHTQPQAISMFDGAIINVDGAMSRGFGPEPRGFVYWLATEDPEIDAADQTFASPRPVGVEGQRRAGRRPFSTAIAGQLPEANAPGTAQLFPNRAAPV